MKEQISECLEGVKEVQEIVAKYKELEKIGELNEYQRGFLDGYTHMQLLGKLCDLIENKIKEN